MSVKFSFFGSMELNIWFHLFYELSKALLDFSASQLLFSAQLCSLLNYSSFGIIIILKGKESIKCQGNLSGLSLPRVLGPWKSSVPWNLSDAFKHLSVYLDLALYLDIYHRSIYIIYL